MNQIQILFKNIFMQILLVDVIILDCMLMFFCTLTMYLICILSNRMEYKNKRKSWGQNSQTIVNEICSSLKKQTFGFDSLLIQY